MSDRLALTGALGLLSTALLPLLTGVGIWEAAALGACFAVILYAITPADRP